MPPRPLRSYSRRRHTHPQNFAALSRTVYQRVLVRFACISGARTTSVKAPRECVIGPTTCRCCVHETILYASFSGPRRSLAACDSSIARLSTLPSQKNWSVNCATYSPTFQCHGTLGAVDADSRCPDVCPSSSSPRSPSTEPFVPNAPSHWSGHPRLGRSPLCAAQPTYGRIRPDAPPNLGRGQRPKLDRASAGAEPGARADSNAYGWRHHRGLSADGYSTNVDFQSDIGNVIPVMQQSWNARRHTFCRRGLVGLMGWLGRGDARRAGSFMPVRTIHIFGWICF
jgi:hypothetical protein